MWRKGHLISMHQLELKPGITAEQFEEFLARQFHHMQPPDGWNTCVLKAYQGEQAGRYVLILETDDKESWARYFPHFGQVSDEFNEWHAQQPPSLAEFEYQLVSMVNGYTQHVTDYELIAQQAR